MPKPQKRPDALKHGVFNTIFRIGELLEMDEITRDKIEYDNGKRLEKSV